MLLERSCDINNALYTVLMIFYSHTGWWPNEEMSYLSRIPYQLYHPGKRKEKAQIERSHSGGTAWQLPLALSALQNACSDRLDHDRIFSPCASQLERLLHGSQSCSCSRLERLWPPRLLGTLSFVSAERDRTSATRPLSVMRAGCPEVRPYLC
jgi:hypothetical protein